MDWLMVLLEIHLAWKLIRYDGFTRAFHVGCDQLKAVVHSCQMPMEVPQSCLHDPCWEGIASVTWVIQFLRVAN